MRRHALSLIPALLLALNGCGGSDAGGGKGGGGGRGGASGHGGTTGGHGGTTGGGGTGGSSGGTGGTTAGTGGSGGATGGSGGATGGSGGATGGSGGAAGGSSGTTGAAGAAAGSGGHGGTGGSAGSGGSAGATGGSGGATAGSGGTAGVGGVAGAGVGGVGGVAGTGVAGTGVAGAGGIAGAGSGGTGGTVAACGTNNDPDTGTTCNTVVPGGSCVLETMATGSPPAATGGQIMAGTYDLTSRTAYNAPDGGDQDGSPRRETVVVTGTGNDFVVQISQVSGTTMRRQTGTISVSGTMLTFAQTCPPAVDGGDNGGIVGFDVTDTTFTIHDMGDNGTQRLNVYTKR